MGRRLAILIVSLLSYPISFGQLKPKDSAAVKFRLAAINQAIDAAVVAKNIAVLETYYADDFFFTHTTGQEDSKTSWINFVRSKMPPCVSRKHDSVKVEWHKNVALLRGTLSVWVGGSKANTGYALHYLRVYARQKGRWQLVSHYSTAEWKLKSHAAP